MSDCVVHSSFRNSFGRRHWIATTLMECELSFVTFFNASESTSEGLAHLRSEGWIVAEHEIAEIFSYPKE